MEIKPITHCKATVTVPGSKSYTQRALIIAALAQGESVLHNALIAEDTHYMLEALKALGAGIHVAGHEVTVTGTGGLLRNPGGEIYLGNNGTAMRLLTGVAALARGPITLTGSARLCQRPIKPLLDALAFMGVDAKTQNNNGCPPVTVHAHGLRGGRVAFADIESSQYVSAMLICAPYAQEGTVIELQGQIPSLPYVAMTVEVMEAFGAAVDHEAPLRYGVTSGRHYQARPYPVEGDCSSASYFFLAAALCEGTVRVEHINPRTLQGDIGLLPIMEELGCRVARGEDWVEVTGGTLAEGEYTYDMGEMPDMVPTLAALAAVRPGRTIITKVPHLRIKESDRLAALATELKKMGVTVHEKEDGLIVEGDSPHGAEIETYNDHRIAMSFACLGLAIPGIRIKDAGCVDKSFPGFWDELKKLYPQ
ncbi:MAG: 3-phosphoshikimate 1-carboxyvinyltransferase [Deltaproteobacteria bacterium]|nr:3-phosphoshikimate 1-carboxyvinyltransferase [Deltaproteobacteria bacterium]